jgi:hypothetical protein
MSITGLDVFDTTVQKTNNWLHDLMQVLRWPDKHKIYLALRVTPARAARPAHSRGGGAPWRAAPDAGPWVLL